MTPARRSALLHLIKGIPDQDVAVGDHDLSGCAITFRFPPGSGVARAAGTAGDGFDEYTPTSKGLSLATVALFLRRAGAVGPHTKTMWKEAIAESLALGDKAEDHYPAEAVAALDELRAEMKRTTEKAKRKTSALRRGLKGVEIATYDPAEVRA